MYYNQNTILYLNQQYLKASEATADLYGQTLHYGYGVFEGIRAYKTPTGTKIFKATEHFQRLQNSCNLIGIPFHYDINELIEASYKTLEANQLQDAYIRPLVFCDPNMSLTKPTAVNILIAVWHWGAYLGDSLLNICTSSYCRPHPKSIKIEAKACGHYVNSILATTEAKANGFDEALLLDTEGNIAEGPGANLFFEKNNKLYTPQTGHILPGITRATVLDLCQQLNITCTQGKFSPQDLLQADSAFYCGTAAEVIGIQALDGHSFPKAWPETIGYKLQQAYKALVMS